MIWLLVWIGILVVSAGGVIVSAYGLAFERGVAADMQALESKTRTAQSPPPMRSEVPPVVDRYLTLSGANGAPVRTARMTHGGSMRGSPDGSWMSVQGKQVFVADPPGFVWWGRMKLAPGIWVDAQDQLASGKARMHVLAASIFPLANVESPELDEGAALRVLGEMVLFPTSFRDTRYVRWEPVDESHARAFLQLGGLEVSALFEFGADGMPAKISARRYRDVDGAGVLTPWFATASDYRSVEGLRVPFRLEATWELESGPFPCVRFDVEEITFERGPALRTDAANVGPS